MSYYSSVYLKIFKREKGEDTQEISVWDLSEACYLLIQRAGIVESESEEPQNHWIGYGLPLMRKASLLEPDVLFQVTTISETFNCNRYYILNGLYQMVEGEIVFPEFNPTQLRKHYSEY